MVGKEKDEFQMTPDEMQRITKALKDEKFRDLLVEYANEISDPVNRKKYEEEIVAMEKQRGQQVRLLRPQAGFVIKTCRISDNMKVFINICTSPDVESYTTKDGKQNGTNGAHISLPHTLTPARDDVDKAGKTCIVCDVCFHPTTYQTALDNDRFRSLLIETALDTLEKNTDIRIDRKNKRFPKMTYKGVAHPAIIRLNTNEQNLDQENNNDHITGGASESIKPLVQDKTSNGDEIVSDASAATTPKYKIIHRGYFDMQNFTNNRDENSSYPKELVVEIDLPLAKSASGIDLDIFEKQLKLVSVDPAYHLHISLPCKVDEDNGKAQFDKSKKLLTVTLPVQQSAAVSQAVEKKFVDNLQMDVQSESSSELITVLDDTVSLKNQNSGPDENKLMTENKNIECQEDKQECDSSQQVHDKIQQDISLADMENLKFDTTVLESLPGNAKLPPYCFEQTAEQIVVVVKVANVRIANLSLGFTSQQVCLSFPQNLDDPVSPDWSMVIRLADGNYLEKDECGFNLHDDCFELNLRKRHDSLGLWERFFVGLSEVSLQVEMLVAEEVAVEMLKEISKTAGAATLTQGDMDDLKVLRLEGRLDQLLSQQNNPTESSSTPHFDKDILLNHEVSESEGKTEESATDTSDKTSEMSDEDDDMSLQLDLLDLQDDVVVDSSPLTSPSSNQGERLSRFTTQRVYERSLSHDIIKHPRLRSILKRSKSDGGSYDTDGECSYSRGRAATFSEQNYKSQGRESGTRRRHKSVTFSEEPLVFEFTKLSKRQWKRQHKEDKQREKLEKKVTDMLSQASVKEDVSKAEETPGKLGKKKKKEKRRQQRNNSESRSEEEGETSAACKKSRKKKKKNKHRNCHEPEYNSSGADSSGETPARPTFTNSLIFELE